MEAYITILFLGRVFEDVGWTEATEDRVRRRPLVNMAINLPRRAILHGAVYQTVFGRFKGHTEQALGSLQYGTRAQ
jgi:hypothetical protein